jgi:polysaccharide pyruvyl transferase WcaK-like protein
MIGVGANRLDSPAARLLAGVAVRTADLLVLRDEESADVMTSSGVPGPLRVGAEPAWSLLQPVTSALARPARLRVVLPTWAHHHQVRFIFGSLRSAIGALLDAGIDVQLQHFDHPGGREIVAFVDEFTRPAFGFRPKSIEILGPPQSLQQAVDSLVEVGALVAYDLHALIAAAAAQVPAIAVGQSLELHALAHRLDQRCLPIDVNPDVLAHACAALLTGPAPLPELVADEVARAHEEFRLLRVLLAHGRSDEVDQIRALPFAPTPAITPPKHR